MIAKIAVSAATYAIDKPYSYRVAEDMALCSGQRVMIPFGRGNRRTEYSSAPPSNRRTGKR